MPVQLTRRHALAGTAALLLASCGGGEPPPATGPRAGSGGALLNSLVALERAAVAAWAAIGEVLSGDARRYAGAIRGRQVGHVDRLSELVRRLGGTPAPAHTRAEYAALFPLMHTQRDGLHFARDLEERLVRAYLEALQSLPDEAQRRAAAEIAAEEAENLAVVHVLAGGPAAPQPFVTGAS